MGTITSDKNFPAEAVQLFHALNHCCEGSDIAVVQQAAGNFFASVIHNSARMAGCSEEQFEEYAVQATDAVLKIAMANWNCRPQPGDIPARQN